MPPGGPKHICTMVDSGYLCFGLALHASVRDHSPDWTLHVACLDATSHAILRQLDLEGLHAIHPRELEEFEPGLLVAREVRPPFELAWTSKPFAMRLVLEQAGHTSALTWLDADAMCFSGLDPLLGELGDSSVLLARQGVAPAFEWVERRTGAYMSGLVSFRNDAIGRKALSWWSQRCLYGGCPRTPDEHRFGDQKYLREIPARFEGVACADSPALRLAPFNIEQHDLVAAPEGVLVDGVPLAIYQYTGFREFRDGSYEATYAPWRISADERTMIYEPFLLRVRAARRLVRTVSPEFDGGFAMPSPLPDRIMGLGSRTKGTALRSIHSARTAGMRARRSLSRRASSHGW